MTTHFCIYVAKMKPLCLMVIGNRQNDRLHLESIRHVYVFILCWIQFKTQKRNNLLETLNINKDDFDNSSNMLYYVTYKQSRST